MNQFSKRPRPLIKMNRFSVLDTSDNEEEQKVVPQKKATGKDSAPAAKNAPAATKKEKEAPKVPRVGKDWICLLDMHSYSVRALCSSWNAS